MTEAKLIYVDDDLPGISRRRAGKGWSYSAPDGKRITDKDEIERLNAIALPPAYQDAWYCPAANGHILATGYDAKGRKQYRYHPDFRAERDAAKYDACSGFGHALPLLRARVEDDMKGRKLDRQTTIAAVVRLLDLYALRVGNEQYVSNRSFGATTLRRRHAKLTGRQVKLAYRAKSGKQREVNITDRTLAAIVRRMQDLPGQHLFRYIDRDGCAHPVSSSDVNAYLKEAMGSDFSAKHFRTWAASVLTFEQLACAKDIVPLKQLLDYVSSHLGNTPTIARNSYIHPELIALAKDGQEEWRSSLCLPRTTRYLDRYERGLLEFLEN